MASMTFGIFSGKASSPFHTPTNMSPVKLAAPPIPPIAL